jgi:chemotaxis protein methyltransferase CheR
VIYTSKVDHINQVLRGFDFEERKHNLNLSNYKRIEGKELPDHYFVKQANKLVPDAKLFVNTKHMMHNEINEAMLKKSNLIIYRNRLLNFNRTLQVEVVNNLINSLKTGGYLVLGVKERLVDDANRELFSIFNIKESIYKKKN